MLLPSLEEPTNSGSLFSMILWYLTNWRKAGLSVWNSVIISVIKFFQISHSGAAPLSKRVHTHAALCIFKNTLPIHPFVCYLSMWIWPFICRSVCENYWWFNLRSGRSDMWHKPWGSDTRFDSLCECLFSHKKYFWLGGVHSSLCCSLVNST